MVSGSRDIHHLEGPEGERGLTTRRGVGSHLVGGNKSHHKICTSDMGPSIWDHHMESTDMESMEMQSAIGVCKGHRVRSR